MGDGSAGTQAYTTYMVEDQMLHEMREVEAALAVETSSLGPGPHQVMVGGQLMSLVTTGAAGATIASGPPLTRVVLLNGVSVIDGGGTCVAATGGVGGSSMTGHRMITMSTNGATDAGVGVVVVNTSENSRNNSHTVSIVGGDGCSAGGDITITGTAINSYGAASNGDNNSFEPGTIIPATTLLSIPVSKTGRRTKFKAKKSTGKSSSFIGHCSSVDKLPDNRIILDESKASSSKIPYNPMDEFPHQHHLTKSQVEGLFMILGPHYTNPGRRAPLKDFVLASLVLLSTKDSYRVMSERMVFKSRGWMHKTIHLFCQLMVKHLSCLIEWPSGDDVKEVQRSFESIMGIPGVVGSMHSCHMAITKAPVGKSSSFYSNLMQFHSIHLMAVCDHRYKFTYINIGRPGSFHESKVFKRSSLYQIIENEPHSIFPPSTHIIADTSFPLSEHILTPYPNINSNQNRHQKQFNLKLYHTKRAIEYAFQLLRARWQRLKCLEMQQVNNMSIAIKTCCILHNICMNNSGYNDPNYNVDEEKNVEVEYVGALPYSALKKRDMIALYLDGQAPWGDS